MLKISIVILCIIYFRLSAAEMLNALKHFCNIATDHLK